MKGRSLDAPEQDIRIAAISPRLRFISEYGKRARHEVARIASESAWSRRRDLRRPEVLESGRGLDDMRQVGDRRRPSVGPSVITRRLVQLILAYKRHGTISYPTTSRVRRGWGGRSSKLEGMA
jgi:hypothetical protein